MDTPLHSRDKWWVKTVGFWRRTDFEEGEDGEIGRQGDGHGFLGCTRNHLHRLLGKRTNDNLGVLCVVIAPVERRNQEKTSLFEKDPLPSRQCTCAHPRSFDGLNNFFYFQNWKNGSADSGLHQTRSSSKPMPILRTFRNPTFWMA